MSSKQSFEGEFIDPSSHNGSWTIPYADHIPFSDLPATTSYPNERPSWESSINRDSQGLENPFTSQARAASDTTSQDDEVNTQAVSAKHNILPFAGLLIFPEDIENDDDLHNPDTDETRTCEMYTLRGFTNVGGLAIITFGLLFMFVGYPAMTFIEKFTTRTDPCHGNTKCISTNKVPLLSNIRSTLIDPETPRSAYTKIAYDGSEWNLVFSDEFNTPGRTFYDGDDPFFQAVDLWYGATVDLEWYDPDAVTTIDGVLEIRFDAFQNHNLNYRSGMVQSWNKLCMKGGRLEASLSLPGRGDTVGFWPGFWTLGNLARPGYAATTEGMWPYSYDNVCDAGITPNQSSPDGISFLPGMKLPACTCANEDHPTPGISRSSPEIDVIEATAAVFDSEGNTLGQASQTFQIAPMDIWQYPNYDFVEVYDYTITQVNAYRGGPYQQALSALSNLNNTWYDGKQYQTYAFEYNPGSLGEIVWFIGDQAIWKLTGEAIGPNGNVAQRIIPEEPMSIIMNFAMADGFSDINFTGIAPLLPATMRFDYIRIYQDDDGIMGCDPPGYETTSYIARHPEAYTNPNITSWTDIDDYSWPKNILMDGC